MDWIVNDLIEHLKSYDPNDEVLGTIWSKKDVAYVLEVIGDEPEEYEVTYQIVERANAAEIWDNNKGLVEGQMSRDIEYLNNEIFSFVLEHLGVAKKLEETKCR